MENGCNKSLCLVFVDCQIRPAVKNCAANAWVATASVRGRRKLVTSEKHRTKGGHDRRNDDTGTLNDLADQPVSENGLPYTEANRLKVPV